MTKQRHRELLLGVIGLVSIGLFFVSMPLADRSRPAKPDLTAAAEETSLGSNGNDGGYVTSKDERSDDHPWQTESQTAFGPSRKQAPKLKNSRYLTPAEYVTIEERTYPRHTYRTLLAPNDPSGTQWWTTQATLDTAWDITPGSHQTTLAIIDTGFGLQHEEFSGRWHRNDGEAGPAGSENPSQLNCTARGLALDYACNLVDDDVDGVVDNENGAAPYENPSRLNCTDQGIPLDMTCNRVDDDENGYIDDVTGWDAINQDNSVQAGELNPSGTGTTHGTMVAGTAAATGNNGKGIAGVNWQTKILPIQALDDDGYGDTRSVGQAIRYAVGQGADVINISLGTDYHDSYVREGIEQATAAGITVVASSGNDGCECIVYPARYPEVIAVGATTTDGSAATFSSWGSSLDIMAPGTNMTLPSWSSSNQTARYVSDAAGTSFASPLVAGAVALMKSHQAEAMPLHLIAATRETSDRARHTASTVSDSRYGYGSIDVNKLRTRMTTPQHDLLRYVFSPTAAGNVIRTGAEQSATYDVTKCSLQSASMPLYELKKTGSTFYSISEVEARLAVADGYEKTNFVYACLAQPHDTAETVRALNIFREFKNLLPKF